MSNTNAVALKDTVAKVKLIARDMLRSKLISARLSKISALETEKKNQDSRDESAKKSLETAKKSLAIATYKKTVLDKNHPAYTDYVAAADEEIKYATENVETVTKHVETVAKSVTENKVSLDKEIADHNEGIKKIEDGTTKVSAEELADLTETLLVTHAKNAVATLG